MKKFKATKFDETNIELESSDKLEELYQTIEQTENFILEWTEGDVEMSKVIMASDLIGKVKSGDVELTAKSSEDKEEE